MKKQVRLVLIILCLLPFISNGQDNGKAVLDSIQLSKINYKHLNWKEIATIQNGDTVISNEPSNTMLIIAREDIYFGKDIHQIKHFNIISIDESFNEYGDPYSDTYTCLDKNNIKVMITIYYDYSMYPYIIYLDSGGKRLVLNP